MLTDENTEFECRGLFGKEIRQAFANKSDLNPAICVLTSGKYLVQFHWSSSELSILDSRLLYLYLYLW